MTDGAAPMELERTFGDHDHTRIVLGIDYLAGMDSVIVGWDFPQVVNHDQKFRSRRSIYALSMLI